MLSNAQIAGDTQMSAHDVDELGSMFHSTGPSVFQVSSLDNDDDLKS
jgi:hypothetical protein